MIRSFRGCVLAIALVMLPLSAWAGGMLGANKFDLLAQYLGFASNGDGSPPYVKVTRAMARKAILDAHDAGFDFLRVSVSGFFPIKPDDRSKDVLPLWQSDSVAFWHGADAMFDDLDRAKIRLVANLNWNFVQFPAIVAETTADFIGNPQSRSRALAQQFITEFISRYHNRPTVLFWELTNEDDLQADLDLHHRCQTQLGNDPATCIPIGNFTSAQLDAFAHDMVAVVHLADPSRLVSSGYSQPRRGAWHLVHQPEFAYGRADWTADSVAQFSRYISDSQRSFDIVSMHISAGDRQRFDHADAADIIRMVGQLAHSLGKKMFVGEFNDPNASPVLHRMVQTLDDGSVDYAALWVWELYQRSTFGPPNPASIEPGLRDDVISVLHRPGAPSDGATAAPRVVLTWPLPCARLNSPITLAAVASNGVTAPERVEFLIDRKPVGTVPTPPYRLVFDPRRFPAAPATIEARALGRSGKLASDSSPVLLNGAGAACSVAPN